MKAFWTLATTASWLLAATSATAQFANPNGGQPNAAAGPAGANAAAAASANDPATDPLFAALDADGDGVITKKELGKAVAILKKLDTDKDGTISWEEVKAARAAAGGAPANAANQGQVGQNVQGQGVNNAPGPIGGNSQNVPTGTYTGGSNGDPMQTTKRLMQYDKNGDGRLTSDELPPQMVSMLRGADQNGDGALDARELAMWAEQMGRRANATSGQAIGQQNAGQQMPGHGNVPQRRP